MINAKYITHRREPFFEIAKEIIDSHHSVLDIGAGNGEFAEFCDRRDMFLFEGNPDSVFELKEKFKNVKEGKLPILPYADEFFDVIHMSHVIEHLQPQEVYDTLKEINRCCKPGGAVIISAPMLWEGFYDDLSHVKPYNPIVLRKYLCPGGFTNLTRPAISRNFIMERLEYRFQEKRNLYSIGKLDNFIARLANKIRHILIQNGFKKFYRTGYTIVLRKEMKL